MARAVGQVVQAANLPWCAPATSSRAAARTTGPAQRTALPAGGRERLAAAVGLGGLAASLSRRRFQRHCAALLAASQETVFESFSDFLFAAQNALVQGLEAEEAKAAAATGQAPAKFLLEPWERKGPAGAPSRGVTGVLQEGLVWEKAAASISVLHGRLTKERAESLSGDGVLYEEGEPYSAAALSIVFHPRSPMVPTLRGDVRLFEVPGRQERWFGGGADLTPVYFFEEDTREFHKYWRQVCQEVYGADAAAQQKGDHFYAQMKHVCDDYFYIPARREHRGVGGIFFDRLQDSALGGAPGAAAAFARAVASGWLASYIPIVKRRVESTTTEAMRDWQCLRRGRYVEFNLLYDRGVRFGLAQLEKVMVSAPPMVAWRYLGEGKSHPAADATLLEVLSEPREWAFDAAEGELVEFLAEGQGASKDGHVGGVLPRGSVLKLGLRFRGIGVLVLEQGAGTGGARRILCHKRAETKSTHPGCWDMLVGGVAGVKEPAAAAAARETQEELGLKIESHTEIHHLGMAVDVESGPVRCSCDVFALAVPASAAVKPEDGEVSEVAWLTVDEVRSRVAASPEQWVASGLQVWKAIEAAGGPDFAAQVCKV